MMIPFCDLHTHILPGMDDGSKDPEMSVQMLKAQMEQGVDRVFLTPHYYPVESVASFIARRDRAMDKLAEAMAKETAPLPQVCLGAEVAYRPGIGYEPDLRQLCLGNSEYLLLELPFAPWSKDILRDIRNMICTKGITPILAHLDRYMGMQKKDIFQEVLEQGVLVQLNAESLLHWRTRAAAKKLLKQGAVHALGSDSHNLRDRAPNLRKALTAVSKMDQALDQICYISGDIFEQAHSL